MMKVFSPLPWGVKKITNLSSAIRFEHTLFALPFAYIGMILANNELPSAREFAWITVAMASARTIAMTLNRIAHAREDASNPRTRNRHIPKGIITKREMLILMFFSGVIFVFASYQLNNLAFLLSPVAIFILVLYTYAKYFTWACHFILGLADGIAPVGAWLAITGTVEPKALLLAWVVTLWIGGFDIVYACLDRDFDKRFGIHSVPARFGIKNALLTTRVMHSAAAACLLIFGLWMNFGSYYYIGWVMIVALLAFQNYIVKPHDLRRAGTTALKINIYIGLALILVTSLEVFL